MAKNKKMIDAINEKGIEIPQDATNEEIEAVYAEISNNNVEKNKDIKKENKKKIIDSIDVSKQKIVYIEGDKFDTIYFYQNTSDKTREVRIAGKFYYLQPNEIVGFTLSAVRPMQNYEKEGVLYLGFKNK